MQVPKLACNVGAGGCLQTGCALSLVCTLQGVQTPGWRHFSGAEGRCCVRKPQASPSGGAAYKQGLGLTGLWGAPLYSLWYGLGTRHCLRSDGYPAGCEGHL